jgi:hypothetical protein
MTPMIGGGPADSGQTTNQVPNQVPNQVANTIKGSQIQGFDKNKMGTYQQPDGTYILPDGKRYKITGMGSDITFTEIQ